MTIANLSNYFRALFIGFFSAVIFISTGEAALVKDRTWVDQKIKLFQGDQFEPMKSLPAQHHPSVQPDVEEPLEVVQPKRFSSTFQTFRNERRAKPKPLMLKEKSTSPKPVVAETQEKYTPRNYGYLETANQPEDRRQTNRLSEVRTHYKYHPRPAQRMKPRKGIHKERLSLAELREERARIRKVLLNGNGIFLRNSHITGQHTWGRRWKWWRKVY